MAAPARAGAESARARRAVQCHVLKRDATGVLFDGEFEKLGGSNGYETISRSLGGDSASIRYMRPLGSILSSKVTPGGLPGYSFSQRSAMGDDYGPGVY